MADKPGGTSLASSTAPSQAWSRLRSATVPTELRSSLERLAAAHDVTTSSVVIGALAAYLARATGTRDVVLSLPVSGADDESCSQVRRNDVERRPDTCERRSAFRGRGTCCTR